MKHTLHAPHFDPLHFDLSETTREHLFALTCVLIPYAIAAIAVFAYHGQWFM